ncbi:MAG: VOC family protein [Candidatus Zixiibacteriota bacterium]
MQQRLTIITLGVKNLAKSEEFYSRKLGWRKSDDSSDDIIFYDLNGIRLALYPKDKLAEDAKSPKNTCDCEDNCDCHNNENNHQFPGFTMAYNTRSEKEADEIFAELKNKDVKIVKLPEKVFWGGYSGYIADPDSYLWEIAYNPFMEIDDDGNIK